MPFVKRERKYYKDGVEVPADTITDFGSTKYYKNIVTTKYWKEITTGSRELEYACYTYAQSSSLKYYFYAKVPIGSDLSSYTAYEIRQGLSWAVYNTKVTSSSELAKDTSVGAGFKSISENSAECGGNIMGAFTVNGTRSYTDDLYKDTTTTTVVEGTPEDYTYTTEETTKVEVSADDDYDYTEFIPSAQFDNYVDTNKLYSLARRKRTYYKYDEESTPINENGAVTSATGGNGWVIYPQTNYNEVFLMLNATANTTYPRWQTGSPNVYAYFKTPKKGIVTSYLTTQWCDENSTGRICNHWIITGYESEADMLALTNGSVIDDNTWASASKGASKTVTLENDKAFQYYTIHMVSNFANGSYCSMGNTKFYMREPVESTSSDYDYYKNNLVSYTPAVQDDFTYRIIHKQAATGTYTITLDKDYEAKLLFVGNGGGGGSSANDSYWRNSSGGSGACFQGRVSLPKGTYTLTIGTLGYGYFIGNTANMTGGADSTDSYLTDENGNELIRVGCGKRGTVIGQGGAGGTLTLGTLEVLETTKAVNGNTGEWNNQYGQGVQKFAKSAYDGTTTGYGAGTSSYYGGGNVYGVAGIFKLDIEYLDKGLRSY